VSGDDEQAIDVRGSQINVRGRTCARPLAGGVAARESGGVEPGAPPPGVDMPDMGRDWASRLATTSSGSSNFTDSELDTARRSGIAAWADGASVSGCRR